jgi:ribosome-binding protein aMBF1 (putative translation factor)
LSRAAAEAMEEGDDIAVFDARTAELRAARDAKLPPEVTASVLRGESLLRALRRWKDMTQEDVARRAKLAQGYVSDLENGRKIPTPRALRAIAKALDVAPAGLGA